MQLRSGRSILVFALFTVLALSACGKQDKAGHGGPGGRGNQPVPVEAQIVALQDWSDSLRALGTVRAHEAVTVTAKVSETVQQVHFESGQDIAKGAPQVHRCGCGSLQCDGGRLQQPLQFI